MSRKIIEGISLKIIGDTGPFSLVGKSICYQLEIEGELYLIDCGAPLFELIGYENLMKIKGIFGTHSHDDHKRTFTDLALFYLYEGRGIKKLPLITTETIHEEYHKSSKAALERSLSADSKRVVDVPYDSFVEKTLFGPKAKYKIEYLFGQQGGGIYRVIDNSGNVAEPTKAKVFISPKSNIPRMLYRDDLTGEWVEPISYYPFDSEIFYEKEQNIYKKEGKKFSIKAINAHSWHGIPCIGLEISTNNEKLVITSDTVYNPKLWKELYTEKREQKLSMSRFEFNESFIIRDDINNYIERTWSRQRYELAMKAYDNAVVLHDVAAPGSVVHTDYPVIASSNVKKLILTHSPDNFVSIRPLSRPGKTYRIIKNEFYEEIDGKLFMECADIYIKKRGKNFVGFKDKEGRFEVVKKEDGMLDVVESRGGKSGFKVNLFAEIGGGYYPALNDISQEYKLRPDGRIEMVTYHSDRSIGEMAENFRDRLAPEVKRK